MMVTEVKLLVFANGYVVNENKVLVYDNVDNVDDDIYTVMVFVASIAVIGSKSRVLVFSKTDCGSEVSGIVVFFGDNGLIIGDVVMIREVNGIKILVSNGVSRVIVIRLEDVILNHDCWGGVVELIDLLCNSNVYVDVYLSD